MQRALSGLALAALLAGCAPGPAPAPRVEPTETPLPAAAWTLALSVYMDHPLYQASLRLAERAGPALGGRVAVLPGTRGQDDAALLAQVADGSLDLAWVSAAAWSAFVPAAAALGLPGLFDGEAAADRALESPAAAELLTAAEGRGVRGLAWGSYGFLIFTNRDPFPRQPADLAGQSVRVVDTVSHPAWWRALGAEPVDLPFGQVFQALWSQRLRGEEAPLATVYSARLYRAQRHVVITRHAFDAAVLVANQRRFQELGSAGQRALQDVASDVARRERAALQEAEGAMAQKMQGEGYHVEQLDPALRRAWLLSGRPAAEAALTPYRRTLEALGHD